MVLELLYPGVRAALLADASLAALIGTRAWDTLAPPNATFPFLTFGGPTSASFGTFGNPGNDDTLTIDLWDRTAGAKKETPTTSAGVNVLYGHVERILNDKRLTIGGMTHVVGRTVLVANLLDVDGLTRHGVVRYSALSFG